MSKNSRMVLLAAMAGCGFFAAVLIWHLQDQADESLDADFSQSTRDAVDHAPRGFAGSLQGIQSPSFKPLPLGRPLPPVERPFSATYRELSERAAAGDSWAKCQLAVELIRCRDAMGILESKERSDSLAKTKSAATSDPMSREFFNRVSTARFAAVTMTADQCADVPPDAFHGAQKLLREAAIVGHEEAALMYLEGRGFDQARMADALRDPEFRLWYDNARAIVTARAISGDARSVWILSFGFTSLDTTPLDALLGNDEASAFMYSNLVRLLSGKPIVEQSSALSPNQVRMMNERAQRIFRTSYGGRVLGENVVRFDPATADATQMKNRHGCGEVLM